jgi:uncharacterized integral membrane protein
MPENDAPPETTAATEATTGAALNTTRTDSAEPSKTPAPAPARTNAGRLWVAIGVAVVLLVLLIIFIAENSHHVTISFLGASGTISAGLAMLISAVAGAVVTLLVGTARILQLRHEVRRQRRRHV